MELAGTAGVAYTQPPLIYRPEGPQPESTIAFAKLYRQSSWTPKWLISADIVVVLLLGVAALLRPGWLAVLIGSGVIAAGLGAIVVGYALRVRALGSEAAQARITKQVTDELDVLSPEAIVYMSADAGQSQYILNQWVPTIEKLLPKYRRRVDEGYGDEAHSALFRLQRELFPAG